MRSRWKRSDLPSWMVVAIVARQGFSAWEYLTQIMFVPPKVVRAAIYRDVNRDLLNYGVCVERPFLTPQGRCAADVNAAADQRRTTTAT